MHKAERIRAVLRGQELDRIPWALYPSYLILGSMEFTLRSKGLGLYCPVAVHRMAMPKVEVVDEFKARSSDGLKTVTRKYRTPKGELSGVLSFKYETAFHSMFADSILSQPGSVPGEGVWTSRYFLTGIEDYKILEFIIENTCYSASYESIVQRENFLGEEGIALAAIWKTPFQSLVYDWMGPETCYVEYHEHPQQFRRLYGLMCEKQKELIQIIADSPAQEVWIGENLTTDITSPPLFKEFCLPFYKECCDVLHRNNKIVGCHFDGKLKGLDYLIAQTQLDFIDAFTPPPIGDLPLKKARALWSQKAILCNFPGSVFFWKREEIKRYTISLLNEAAPGDHFMLVTTENFPVERWIEGFTVVAEVLEKYGTYPITV